jgi:hypothetical protein
MSKSEWQERQDKPHPKRPYVEKCFEMAHCPACGKRVPMGEIAVWAERKAWHYDCGRHLLGPVQESLL